MAQSILAAARTGRGNQRIKGRIAALGLGTALALVPIGAWMLWMWSQMNGIPAALDAAEASACQVSLKNLHAVLREEGMAADSELEGDALFCALSKQHPDVGAKDLSCPSYHETLHEIGWDDHDCNRSGYALADRATRQKALLDGGIALAACSNAGWPSHRDKTHLLLADGSIVVLSLAALKEVELVPSTEEFLRVGPDSPIEMLRTLRTD